MLSTGLPSTIVPAFRAWSSGATGPRATTETMPRTRIIAATVRMTLVVPTKSAMGPTTMIGTKLATETSMFRTPKTRPRTASGRSSWSWVWLEIATIP